MYLDNVILFHTSVEEHADNFDEVISLLGSAGTPPKYSKCIFYKYQVDYLVQVVLRGTLTSSDKSSHIYIFDEANNWFVAHWYDVATSYRLSYRRQFHTKLLH